jgi:hypothetical protein
MRFAPQKLNLEKSIVLPEHDYIDRLEGKLTQI